MGVTEQVRAPKRSSYFLGFRLTCTHIIRASINGEKGKPFNVLFRCRLSMGIFNDHAYNMYLNASRLKMFVFCSFSPYLNFVNARIGPGLIFGQIDNNLWQRGPDWLSKRSEWPPKVALKASPQASEEEKCARSTRVLATTSQLVDNDVFDKLIEKYPLRKVLRICAWIWRFIQNCRVQPGSREPGPLKTTEISDQDLWWIKRVQRRAEGDQNIEGVKRELNLQPNERGILGCCGSIDGEYPIYLPRDFMYTQKVVEHAHFTTLHGGVAMTMAKVRERFWVPKLRSLVKRTRGDCHGCVRFRAQSYQKPPPGKF